MKKITINKIIFTTSEDRVMAQRILLTTLILCSLMTESRASQEIISGSNLSDFEVMLEQELLSKSAKKSTI